MYRLAKIREFNGVHGITIPKEILSKMTLQKGDTVVVTLSSPTSFTVRKDSDVTVTKEKGK